MTNYQHGDAVYWQTPQGKTKGTLKERKTEEFTFKGQQFKASNDEPYWIVESNKSGSEAAHKEDTLKKA